MKIYYYITASTHSLSKDFTRLSNIGAHVCELNCFVDTSKDKSLRNIYRTSFTRYISETLYFDNKFWAQVAVQILKKYINLDFKIVKITRIESNIKEGKLITWRNFCKSANLKEFTFIHPVFSDIVNAMDEIEMDIYLTDKESVERRNACIKGAILLNNKEDNNNE